MTAKVIPGTWNDRDVAPANGGAGEDVSLVLPAEAAPEANEHATLGLVELLLKDPDRVDSISREAARQRELIPRFLGIALGSYLLFSAAMLVILNASPAEAWPRSLLPMPSARWSDGTAIGLVLAYTIGLVAATGVCLPSFYFYGLLAGVKMSMTQVTGQILKGKAAHAVMLVGILPIYVAVVMGMIVFGASAPVLELWLYLGLALPFLAGFWGMYSIYRGAMGFADTLPPWKRCRRACFLRRLVLAWSACYAAVSPVMVYRLWEYFAGAMGAQP